MGGILFETLATDILLFSTILLYIFYRYSTSTYNYWKLKGVPHLKPIPLFGNTRSTILLQIPLYVGLRRMYEELAPHPFGGIYDLREPMIILRDPDLLKQVLVKDFYHFQDRGFRYNDEVEPLSANLLVVGGERWKNLRSKLSPAFSSGKLKQMFPLIVECSEILKQVLESKIKTEGEIQECRNLIFKFSTDVVGSCAFGINCNCLSDQQSEFTRIGSRMTAPSLKFTIQRIVRFFFPKISDIFNLKEIPEDVTAFFLKLTKETLEYREKNNVIRQDFMEILRQLKNKGIVSEETNEGEQKQEKSNPTSILPPVGQMDDSAEKADKVFDNNLLSAQAFSFFVAGFETTSAALTFCLHELAMHQDIQDKLRSEIVSMLKETDGKILYENINTLPYLEKVFCETLRKHPTAGHTLRRVTKPYLIPNTNVTLEEGTVVLIATYGLHYDPQYYPNPQTFDPERFSKENIAKRHPYAYMPFGVGPRICIGMRFAVLEIKAALAALLPNFKFEPCHKTKDPPELDTKTMFMSLKNGAWLNISKIQS